MMDLLNTCQSRSFIMCTTQVIKIWLNSKAFYYTRLNTPFDKSYYSEFSWISCLSFFCSIIFSWLWKTNLRCASLISWKFCVQWTHTFFQTFWWIKAEILLLKVVLIIRHWPWVLCCFSFSGKKVWDEVAEHSKEFIQEYLEEFPNVCLDKTLTAELNIGVLKETP